MKVKGILQKVFTGLLVIIGCTFNSFAQSSATASVAATVIAPITIVKSMDMNFGNAAVSVVSGGTVILSPSGSRTAGGGGVTLPANTGTVAAASFTVTGAPAYTYSISLPSSAVINGPAAATMTVNNFTSTPPATGVLSNGGSQTISVGATLNVAPSQTSGSYTNPTALPITVNYN